MPSAGREALPSHRGSPLERGGHVHVPPALREARAPVRRRTSGPGHPGRGCAAVA